MRHALLSFVVLLASCSSSSGAPTMPKPKPKPSSSVTVTVDHGYGGGKFAPKTTLHLWSDVDPQTSITTSWTGASGLPTEWNGDFVVPDHDVTAKAVIVDSPVHLVSRTYTLAAGKRTVLGHFASSPVGLVLFFHGAQFNVDMIRMNSPSTIAIALARAGYTIVAVPSETETASGVGPWDTDLTSNTDLDNVKALIAAVHADSTVPRSAPIIAWGMSSGGMFAHTVGAGAPTDMVVAYCAPGTPQALAATHAQTGWFMAEKDQTFVTGVTDATGFKKMLDERGVKNQLYVHPTTPLYDERFQRVQGVDAHTSATIAASIRSHKYVDAHDEWLVFGSTITDALNLDGLSSLDETQTEAVAQEIDIMAADHALYDDAVDRMMGFIGAK